MQAFFIVPPRAAGAFTRLLATHPPMEERIARLADDNQVIVFTHDILFATTLLALFEKSKRCAYFQITDESGKGKVSRATGPRIPHLMIIGHNPGITEAANLLAPATHTEDLATAAICSLTFDARTWTGVGAKTVRQVQSESPPARQKQAALPALGGRGGRDRAAASGRRAA